MYAIVLQNWRQNLILEYYIVYIWAWFVVSTCLSVFFSYAVLWLIAANKMYTGYSRHITWSRRYTWKELRQISQPIYKSTQQYFGCNVCDFAVVKYSAKTTLMAKITPSVHPTSKSDMNEISSYTPCSADIRHRWKYAVYTLFLRRLRLLLKIHEWRERSKADCDVQAVYRSS